MDLETKYADFAAEKAIELIGIDSPSGFTEKAAEWVRNEFEALGFAARMTEKGGVIADLGGSGEGLFFPGEIRVGVEMLPHIRGEYVLRRGEVSRLYKGGNRIESGQGGVHAGGKELSVAQSCGFHFMHSFYIHNRKNC